MRNNYKLPAIVMLGSFNDEKIGSNRTIRCGEKTMGVLYGLTLFVSAFLLFLVQPMVGKMILPSLGGTPAVWNTCMLFFQAALLAGYLYAHGSIRWLGARKQAALHICVLLTPLLVLPIYIASDAMPPQGASPAGWLLTQLAIYVGLPFFVISSSAPLLQKWFAQTNHEAAEDPYFLYSISNIGSFTALLAYPIFMEPMFTLTYQSWLWATGFGLLAALTLCCAIAMWKSNRDRRSADSTTNSTNKAGITSVIPTSTPLTAKLRLRWIGLSLIPSSLMLGVTTHITTNLAAVPLLWVIPLALYLLTFVFVFARKTWIPHSFIIRILPFIILPCGLTIFVEFPNAGLFAIAPHLLMFFVVSMACHGELAQSRPSTDHLTEFFLWMSVGGVIGGFCNAIIAPLVFNWIAEYPLMLVLACFMIPRNTSLVKKSRELILDFAMPAGLALIAVVIILALRASSIDGTWRAGMMLSMALILLGFTLRTRPIRLGLGLVVLLTAVSFYMRTHGGERLHEERNFFGVKQIVVAPAGNMRMLVHGDTNHGCQSLDPAKSREPLAYHHRTGPIGDVFTAYSKAPFANHIAVIGLGAGALATYAEPNQDFTFYEIDPAVERLARDTRFFTFMEECRGNCDVIIGDGRLMIDHAPNEEFGIIVLDAFSSDAVPTHLLSQEALMIYLDKLTPNGLIAFNISNRFLAFEPLLAALAQQEGLACITKLDAEVTPDQSAEGKLPSRWLVMARSFDDLSKLANKPGWHAARTLPDIPIWTDQYCSILGLLGRADEPALAER